MTEEKLREANEIEHLLYRCKGRLKEIQTDHEEVSLGFNGKGFFNIQNLPCFPSVMKMITADLEAKIIELQDKFNEI